MPRELKDMTSVKHAVRLVELDDGLVRLVGDIVHERERAMRYHEGSCNSDPATNGRHLPIGAKVDIYYQPTARPERFNADTMPKHSFLSLRRRLVVRDEAGLLSFYTTGPVDSGAGAIFAPIDCAI